MVKVGGGSTFANASIDDVKLGDIKIALSPVDGGLAFRAEIDQLDVPAHADYALLGVGGSDTVRITADKIVIAGTLDVAPNGTAGFKTKIASPDVQLTNLKIAASGIPGAIINLLDLNAAIKRILPTVAELAMNPLMNQALGALGGPQQLAVLGKQIDLQVAPAALSFDPTGAVVELNMKVMIAGSEASPGFVFTENGAAAIDPASGFQIGVADDLANEMLAELKATGTLDLSVPAPGGLFDTAQLHMTLPPSISADATDGNLRLILGDMEATFVNHGQPVARAAINARLDLKVSPLANGASVALQLGTPEIHIDVLDDVANATGFTDDQLANATTVLLDGQIDSISQLLVSIPLPLIAGLNVNGLSIGSDHGYVTVKGQLR
jgi:hypothetical protein